MKLSWVDSEISLTYRCRMFVKNLQPGSVQLYMKALSLWVNM
jgi:hypothetical protein